MALPIPHGQNFQISHRILPSNFEMPSMEAASDHYTILFFISGDRTIITPTQIYTLHAGDIITLSPYVYHRTLPASDTVYESMLIKFTPDFVSDLTETFGDHILDQIYAYPVNYYSDKHRQDIYNLICALLSEYESESQYKEYILKCILSELLLKILEYRMPNEGGILNDAPLSPPIMDAVYYMEKHYSEPISIEKVAEISGYSPAYFSRLFKKQLGKPYSDYLNYIRLKNAQRLLLSTDMSVTEIALETGYQYPGNLSAVFKQKIGMTPHQFRIHHR